MWISLKNKSNNQINLKRIFAFEKYTSNSSICIIVDGKNNLYYNSQEDRDADYNKMVRLIQNEGGEE